MMTRDDMTPKSPFQKLSAGTQQALRLAARRQAGSAKQISAATYLEIRADWVMVPGKRGECQVVVAERAGRFVAFRI